MARIVRKLLHSRPVIVGSMVLLGGREFLALQRTQAVERMKA